MSKINKEGTDRDSAVAVTTAVKYLFTLTLSAFTIYLTPLKMLILTDNGMF